MARSKRLGLLTERQVKVLKLRARGLSLREVAFSLNVSHQDIAVVEKRALRNLELARQTIIAYKLATSPVKVLLSEGTRHVDIPALVIEEADRAGVKIKADISLLLKLIWRRARSCIESRRVKKPIMVLVDREGEVEVYPYQDIQHLHQEIEKL
ncbi:MAG: Tfx family DNA-binding protein [Desulfurococcaceae archaeon]